MSTGGGKRTGIPEASGALGRAAGKGMTGGPQVGSGDGGDKGGRWRRYRGPVPFSLRLSAEERAALEAEAGDTPLGAFIREKLLNGAQAPRQERRRVRRDEAALARLLGELGNARLANNLNQLAKAANAGALPVTPETLQAILDACRDVKTMRACLLAALGFRPDDGAP